MSLFIFIRLDNDLNVSLSKENKSNSIKSGP